MIYLIYCRKCGIQYVGETSQKLRNRLNNHRSNLKKLTCLYLYYHFTSDDHSEGDLSIMSIEQIRTCDGASVTSIRLEREDYWCRELCTYYPYGLNDNVRGVGNISRLPDLIVYTLFNKRNRKRSAYRAKRSSRKLNLNDLTSHLENCLHNYKSCSFVLMLEVYSLRNTMKVVWNIYHNWILTHEIPAQIKILLKDLIAFRKGQIHVATANNDLIMKGPSYREQNYVNWNVTEKLCREAVARYKCTWSRRERIDIRALNEWECKVNECIRRRIASLKRKYINTRKKHLLNSGKHLR